MKSALFRTALVLGLISAIGPFAIDMYLPALPSIGHALNASSGSVQLTLTVFLLALGFGQLVYGPAADIFGRKAPLYFGVGLFALSSVGCALASDMKTLIVFRLLQGLGACAGMVVPRAIVRDMHTGVEATRLMSMLMLVISISPILAPLTGGFIVESVGWRGVFWFVFATALLSLLLLATRLVETRAHHERAASSMASALKSYAFLMRDRQFLGLTMTGAFGVASFFSYLSNSSFVIMEHYHYSARAYGVIFGVNAVAFFAASQACGALITRFGVNRLVRVAVFGYCAPMVILLTVFAFGIDSLWILIGLLFVGFGFLGIVVPTTAVMALDAHGHQAGTASALLGTLQFAVGAVVMVAVAPFGNATALPMIAAIAIVSVITLVLALVSVPSQPAQAADATKPVERQAAQLQ
jgi:DHA1 family bicyclomycin/chloramphenicol resistance-like MFS transporter